jgi:hypothetical protein
MDVAASRPLLDDAEVAQPRPSSSDSSSHNSLLPGRVNDSRQSSLSVRSAAWQRGQDAAEDTLAAGLRPRGRSRILRAWQRTAGAASLSIHRRPVTSVLRVADVEQGPAAEEDTAKKGRRRYSHLYWRSLRLYPAALGEMATSLWPEPPSLEHTCAAAAARIEADRSRGRATAILAGQRLQTEYREAVERVSCGWFCGIGTRANSRGAATCVTCCLASSAGSCAGRRLVLLGAQRTRAAAGAGRVGALGLHAGCGAAVGARAGAWGSVRKSGGRAHR